MGHATRPTIGLLLLLGHRIREKFLDWTNVDPSFYRSTETFPHAIYPDVLRLFAWGIFDRSFFSNLSQRKTSTPVTRHYRLLMVCIQLLGPEACVVIVLYTIIQLAAGTAKWKFIHKNTYNNLNSVSNCNKLHIEF